MHTIYLFSLPKSFDYSNYLLLALDAAQPGFENADPRVRLHYTDAYYVDALHTNARSLLKVGVGYVSPIGKDTTMGTPISF